MISFDSLTASDELANPDPDCDQEQEAGFGCLQTHRGGLPLRRLAVDGRITGLLYRLTVAQEFINTSLEPLEATYIFPLPARAGITRFQLRVAERLIEGVLKERSVARADYDQAIRAGRRAAIAEEERPEVFTVRAGNIQPGETVQVELELSGPLAFADQQATFRFPLVVAPRYIPGLALDGPSVGQGTAWDTDAVPDASRITPPILLPGQPNPIHLSLRLELDPAGLPWSDLRASLHELRLSQTAAALQVVELRPGVERLDRDFILRFRVGGDDIASSLNFYRHPDGEWIGLLTVVPPADSAALRPRDVVVVLDRSGSMDGWKMAAARRAAGRLLDTLTEHDRFGLILFDDQIEEPAPSAGQLIAATDRNRFRAVEFLARVEARGGTEIASALRRALGYFSQPPGAGRERILLFITDGQVGNEDQLLQQVRREAQHCRIFTVGIDRAVNASLLERLAGYGGGHCELVETEDRLDEALRMVHRRLGGPVLTRLRLKPALQEIAPEVTDLFPGVPLRLAGRWPDATPIPTEMTVIARRADGQRFQQILQPTEITDSAIRTVWTRARVLDLEHRFVASHRSQSPSAEEITAFSLRYGVLCRFTAFVAVDQAETVNRGKLRRVTQAVELPAEWAALAMPPDQDEHLDMPAFLRRAVAPIGSFIGSSSGLYRLRSPKMMRYELADSTPAPAQQSTAPDSLPAWFMALEKALTAPDSDPAQQAHAIRAALAELTKLGAGVKELVEQGWGLARQLESGNRYLAELCSRLARWWLRRLRKWLESSHAPANHRRFWWK